MDKIQRIFVTKTQLIKIIYKKKPDQNNNLLTDEGLNAFLLRPGQNKVVCVDNSYSTSYSSL